MEERREVGWKEYTESRLTSIEKEMHLHVAYSEKALEIAKDAADKRNAAENFVREQLREQAATFVSMRVFDIKTEGLEKRVNDLERAKANMDGRFWALGALFVGLQVIFKFFLK